MTAAILTINRRAFASLRIHRNYRLYFLGQAISQTGTWIDKVAQAWLVLALTHSPVAGGILAACQFVPFSVLGLLGGVIVDRLDNWRTVVVTQAVRMGIAGTLAGIVLAGVVQVWMVYVLAAITGIVLVLDAPSRQALTFRMVGRSELPNAVALNSSLFNAASFIAVLVGLLAMDPGALVRLDREEEQKPTLVRGLREGLSYARHSPHVRLLLTMLIAISTIAMNF